MKKISCKILAIVLTVSIICFNLAVPTALAEASAAYPSAYVISDGTNNYLINYNELVASYAAYTVDPNGDDARLAKFYFDTLGDDVMNRFIAYISSVTNKYVGYSDVLARYVASQDVDATYIWFNSDGATSGFQSTTEVKVVGPDGTVVGSILVGSDGYEQTFSSYTISTTAPADVYVDHGAEFTVTTQGDGTGNTGYTAIYRYDVTGGSYKLEYKDGTVWRELTGGYFGPSSGFGLTPDWDATTEVRFTALEEGTYDITLTLETIGGVTLATESHSIDATVEPTFSSYTIRTTAPVDVYVDQGAEFTVTTQGDGTGNTGYTAIYRYDVTGGTYKLEYKDGTVWRELTGGYFGPSSGFGLTPDWDATTEVRFTALEEGIYDITLTLETMGGVTLATESHSIDATVEPTFSSYTISTTAPDDVYVDQGAEFTVTTQGDGTGNTGYTAIYRYDVTGGSYKLEYKDGTVWRELTGGYFGPSSGFGLTPDWDATTEVRFTALEEGTYDITLTLETMGGVTLATESHSIDATVEPTFSTYTISTTAPADAYVNQGAEFTVTTQGDGTGNTGYTAIYRYDVTGGSYKLEYKDGTVWRELTGGYFGPSSGFGLTPDWDATTEVRFTALEAGTYDITLTLETIGGVTLVTENHSIAVVTPVFNGEVAGIIDTNVLGEVSGTLTGDYNLTIQGNVTAYVNNRATFTGMVSGDINGAITATINSNGIDTLSGTLTGTGASELVRITGFFPKTGIKGDFIGEVITGPEPTYVQSMTIGTEGDTNTVAVGSTLQMTVDVDPAGASDDVLWSVWTSDDHVYATIDAETGVLTGVEAGTVTVIAKALDGSLLDATKTITVVTPVTRLTAPYRADSTGGDALEYAFESGVLTITAPIVTIPSVENPSHVEARWVGINIPKPIDQVADSGTIKLTIKEEGKQDVVHEGVSYGDGDPFLYYFGAIEDGRDIILEIVWNNLYQEILVIEYVDTSVVIQETGARFASIQEAIDAASENDTILVPPGIYHGALEISHSSLTLRSTEGRDATIIDADGAETAIFVRGSTGTGNVTIQGFTVQNFTDNGIVQSFRDAVQTVHVLNNRVLASNNYLRNGIQVAADNSTVIGNIVQGAPLTATWSSTGIGVAGGDGAQVRNNVVSSCDIGIGVTNFDNENSLNNVLVENNTLSNNENGVRVSGYLGTEIIDQVTIRGNTITDNINYGINVQQIVLTNLQVTENHISNTQECYDIRFSSSATIDNSIAIHQNVINGSGWEFVNHNPVNINATHNYWGSENPNFGSTIYGNVTYSPYYGDADLTMLLSSVVKGHIERDPGNTGGDDVTVEINGDTVTFGGTIDWYPADATLNRDAGNRVGVQITAPDGFDTSGSTIEIGGTTYDWDAVKDGDNYLWWYPLVTEDNREFTATVVWQDNSTQVFTIDTTGATLEEPIIFSNYTISTTAPTETMVDQGAEFTVRTQGDNTGNTSPTVIYHYQITGGDYTLEYNDGSNWVELTDGYFGPASGFEMTPDWDATTNVRFTALEAGTYDITLTLETIGGDVLATRSHSIEADVETYSMYTITTTAPTELLVNESAEFTVRTQSDGSGNLGCMAIYEYEVTGGTYIMEYNNGTKWIELTGGYFGPSTGFALTPDWDATTEVRFTALEAGTYNITLRLKSLGDNVILASKGHSIDAELQAVSSYTISATPPDDMHVGEGAEFTVRTQGDNTGNTSPTVIYHYTVTGGDYILEYHDGNGWIELNSGYFGPAGGFEITPDWDASTNVCFTPLGVATYNITLTLETMGGEVLATKSHTIEVTGTSGETFSEYSISTTAPTETRVNEGVEFTVRTQGDNTGNTSPNVIYYYEVTGGNYKLEYYDGAEWIELTDGYFGPASGFEITPDWDATTNVRFTALEVGTYDITLMLEETMGGVLATKNHSITATDEPSFSNYTISTTAPTETRVNQGAEFTVRTQGDDSVNESPTVIYYYEVTGGDYTLEYYDGADWIELTGGYFGPPCGFVITPDWDATTEVRFTAEEAGTYNITLRLETIGGEVLATQSHSMEAEEETYSVYTITTTAPTELHVNESVEFTVRVQSDESGNLGCMALYEYEVTGGTYKLEYKVGTEWIELTDGYFGPLTGFALTPDYDVTTDVRFTADQEGTYTITLRLKELGDNMVLATKDHSIEVTAQ